MLGASNGVQHYRITQLDQRKQVKNIKEVYYLHQKNWTDFGGMTLDDFAVLIERVRNCRKYLCIVEQALAAQ